MKQFNPKRSLTNDGWLYTDKNEHSVVLQLFIRWGFDLPAFDTWLENLEPCVAKDELIERRIRLTNQSTDTLKSDTEFLKLRWFILERESFLMPLAKTGKKHSQAQREKATKRTGTKNPLLKTIQQKMKSFKRNDGLFKEFLWSAVNGSIEGVNAKEIPSKDGKSNPSYKFDVWGLGEREEGERLATYKTVEKWWADCDKVGIKKRIS